MKKYLLVAFCILNFTSYSQQWKWAYPLNSDWGSFLIGIEADSQGSPYIMGQFSNPSTFQGTNGSFPVSENGVYITKYDALGNVNWISGGRGNVEGRGFSIDKYSNSYLNGDYYGTAYFGIGTDTLQRTSFQNSGDDFLVKFDAVGKPVFLKTQGDTCGDGGSSVTAFSSDEIIVSGYDGTYCGPFAGGGIGYFKKLNSFGNEIWSLKLPNGLISPVQITPTKDAGFLLCGDWFGYGLVFKGLTDSIYLNPPINPNGKTDYYIAKYSLAGEVQWVKTIRGLDYQMARRVITDNLNNIIIAIWSWDTCYYENLMLLPKGAVTMHVLKMDANGNLINSISIPDASQIGGFIINDLKTDSNGNIYLAGRTGTMLYIGTDTINFNLLPNDNRVWAIIKLDQNFNYIWSQYITAGYCNLSGSIAVTDSLVYVGFNYDYSVSLNGSSYQFPPPNQITRTDCFIAAIKNGYLPSSITEITKPEINVYPNPSSGKFVIQSAVKISSLEIINLLGEKVTHSVIPSGARNLAIDLSETPKGIYFVRVASEGQSTVRKIVLN